MTTPEDLAFTSNAFIKAAAGCGKTELIARAIQSDPFSKCLILTHTNAGVKSLQSRLKKLNINKNIYCIDTIAGFFLRVTSSYPMLSGVNFKIPTSSADYQLLYTGADKLIKNEILKKVIKSSFAKIYIDEYQDCTISQHSLIMQLSEFVDCKIIGDPLQAIFDFQPADPLCDMSNCFQHFNELDTLSIPWRWNKHGRGDLGEWLISIRSSIQNNQSFDLPRFVNKLNANSYSEIPSKLLSFKTRNISESIVVLDQFASQCHKLASITGGRFKSIDEVESKDLLSFCNEFDSIVGTSLLNSIDDFLKKTNTKISSTTKMVFGKIISGSKYNPRDMGLSELYRQASSLSLSKSYDGIEQLIITSRKFCSDAVIYRLDLWKGMLQIFKIRKEENLPSLLEAFNEYKKRQRFYPTTVSNHIIARTLLVKGLEFDHCILANPTNLFLKPKEFYVALTRGSKSINVLDGSTIANLNR